VCVCVCVYMRVLCVHACPLCACVCYKNLRTTWNTVVTLQHPATHSNTLHHAATRCTLQHTAKERAIEQLTDDLKHGEEACQKVACDTHTKVACECHSYMNDSYRIEVVMWRRNKSCNISKCLLAYAECSVLQRVAVHCSVLQRVASCCSMWQCVAVCRSVCQCVAVCFHSPKNSGLLFPGKKKKDQRNSYSMIRLRLTAPNVSTFSNSRNCKT